MIRLILLLKVDKQLPVEHFGIAVNSTPLIVSTYKTNIFAYIQKYVYSHIYIYIYIYIHMYCFRTSSASCAIILLLLLLLLIIIIIILMRILILTPLRRAAPRASRGVRPLPAGLRRRRQIQIIYNILIYYKDIIHVIILYM